MAKSRGLYAVVPIGAATNFSSDLEAFIDGLPDEELAGQLEEALDALDPGKRVEAILAEHDESFTDWTASSGAIDQRNVQWHGWPQSESRKTGMATY